MKLVIHLLTKAFVGICRYGFVELKLSTPEALNTIGVLVTVADGSRHDEGGVVSTGHGLGVGEGPCMLLLE